MGAFKSNDIFNAKAESRTPTKLILNTQSGLIVRQLLQREKTNRYCYGRKQNTKRYRDRYSNALHVDGVFHGQMGNRFNSSTFYCGNYHFILYGDYRRNGWDDALMSYPQKLWITLSLSRHIAPQPPALPGNKLN